MPGVAETFRLEPKREIAQPDRHDFGQLVAPALSLVLLQGLELRGLVHFDFAVYGKVCAVEQHTVGKEWVRRSLDFDIHAAVVLCPCVDVELDFLGLWCAQDERLVEGVFHGLYLAAVFQVQQAVDEVRQGLLVVEQGVKRRVVGWVQVSLAPQNFGDFLAGGGGVCILVLRHGIVLLI